MEQEQYQEQEVYTEGDEQEREEKAEKELNFWTVAAFMQTRIA